MTPGHAHPCRPGWLIVCSRPGVRPSRAAEAAVTRMDPARYWSRPNRCLLEGVSGVQAGRPIMYEMCVGPEKAGGALVWHVLAKQAAATLCGQQLRERREASDGERARHCPDCMASFEKLMATTPC
ncbi:hypothetical protein B9W64_34285 [Streptomyces sp. CS159]|nr:hypothetical protein [Streptomyces sp. SID5477]OWA01512.1 hypothetical protein B9W64_34285 [Streptomyces sp. CS159]